MNDKASFVFNGTLYVVGVDGVNCHKEMLTRLPDGTLVRLDFPPNSLVPAATQVGEGVVDGESIREARVYVRTIEFPAFGHRYTVTVPEDASSLDESLAKLPDGRYVVLFNPIEITDAPFERIVSRGEPLFKAAEERGWIYEAAQIS